MITAEYKLVKARHNRLAGAAVRRLISRSLASSFSSVRLKVEVGEDAPHPGGRLDRPAIFYLNHSSWWDGYLVYLLGRQHWGRVGYLMIDDNLIRKYPFFTYAGGFAVDRHNPRHALVSLNYVTAELQAHPERSLWLFPQGETRANTRRPLNFRSGMATVAKRLGDCYLYPVAIHLDFFEQQRPEALLTVGPGLAVDRGNPLDSRVLTAAAEERLTTLLDAQLAMVNAAYFDPPSEEQNFPGYETIFAGKGSINERVERVLHPLLPKDDRRRRWQVQG